MSSDGLFPSEFFFCTCKTPLPHFLPKMLRPPAARRGRAARGGAAGEGARLHPDAVKISY
ncbi:MAG: hypothetical protein J6M34_02625 [Clostridia bacterium]|nr:hypothetical protein [Clostridia bacterium]